MGEGGTYSLSFLIWDGPVANLRIYRDAEPITSSILSEVPEEGGGSRIFWWSPQGEALDSSQIL